MESDASSSRHAPPRAPPHSPVVPGTTTQQGLDGRAGSRGPGRRLRLPVQVHIRGAPPWPVAPPETCGEQQARSQGLLKPERPAGTSCAWGSRSAIPVTEEAEAGGCKVQGQPGLQGDFRLSQIGLERWLSGQGDPGVDPTSTWQVTSICDSSSMEFHIFF